MSKEEILHRIVLYLMLHTSHQSDIGLMKGKTGISIFFFKYANYSGKKLYRDFAEELIDEIYSEVHINYSCDFESGLSGIAWGIEYLVRNKFVKGNINKVLEDVDKQILERDVRRVNDNSLTTGLKGLAYYVINRCANRQIDNKIIPKEYILDLAKSIKSYPDKDVESLKLSKTLINISNQRSVILNSEPIGDIVRKTIYESGDLFQKEDYTLGLSNNGYAGIGLKIINSQ